VLEVRPGIDFINCGRNLIGQILSSNLDQIFIQKQRNI
jgi:hypothetical protein